MCKPNLPQKFADKSDVLLAATHLINLHGVTTSLEVKETLRTWGLLAFQRDISRFMEMVAFEEDWDWECNGQFKIFSFPEGKVPSYAFSFPAFSLN